MSGTGTGLPATPSTPPGTGAYTCNTLLDIRKAVARESGHLELVEDWQAGDWSVNPDAPVNIDQIIRDASSWLDSLPYKLRAQDKRRKVPIVEGQFFVDPQDLRTVRRIDLMTSDTIYGEMNRRTVDYLRETYGEPYALVDAAQPVDWARGTHLNEVPVEVDYIDDPTFLLEYTDNNEGDTPIAGHWSATYSGEGMAGPNPVEQFSPGVRLYFPNDPTKLAQSVVIFAKDLAITAENAVMTLTLELANVDIDPFVNFQFATTFTPAYSGIFADIPRVSGIHTIEIDMTEAIGKTLNTIQIGATDASRESTLTIMSAQLTYPTATTEEVDIEGVFILPPADQAYTLTLFGNIYSEVLTNDIDMNLWSDKYPRILIRAAKMFLEEDLHRNTEQKEATQKSIEADLRSAYIGELKETTSGPLENYQRRG